MKITDTIKYAGVNDHQVDLFEGQYKVPNGMSYNSYVILDEKVAVMDTVDANFTHEWLDNLEQILDSDEKRRYEDEEELGDKITEIFERGIIQTEAMNFIRGRSIARTYLIIDEAQNMTPNQVKGIITRAGQGTKIILLGDPQQIDKPFLDERTNGLSYAAKHMIDSSLCWQITLSAEECERSALAMDAIKRL